MNEFRHFQIPELAAAKLQSHAEVFLRGVMAEIKRLVAEEVGKQARRGRVLWAGGMFCAGFLLATVLHAVI